MVGLVPQSRRDEDQVVNPRGLTPRDVSLSCPTKDLEHQKVAKYKRKQELEADSISMFG